MAHLLLPVTNNSHAEATSYAAVNITGDIDLRARVALDDWVTGATQSIVSKFSATPATRPYLLAVNAATGTLAFLWSNGTTVFSKSSTVAPTVVDGAILWVRATLDVDNGASGNDVKFYTGGSAETPVWVQLGSTVTTAGTTSIVVNNGVPIQIGVNDTSANDAPGDYYRAQILSGIDGTPAFDAHPADTSTWDCPDKLFFTEKANSQTVTLAGDASLIGDCPAGNRMGGTGAIRKPPRYTP